MTFSELFAEFIELNEMVQSPHEVLNKKNRFINHIFPVFGNIEISNLKYKDIQKFVNELIYKKELSVKTAKNIHSIILVCFNYAIKNEYIDKNPASLVTFPKYDNKYDISLTTENLKNLIHEILHFENRDYRDIFIFALHGRRKNEILSLQWFQVDLTLKTYQITAQKNKSRKNDIHQMTDLLFDMLLERYRICKILKLNKPSDYVFYNPQTLTRYSDIKKPFAKLKELTGISSIRFHDFRHILGTYSILKKVPIEHISQALGHSSIEVTQKYITKDCNISKSVCDVFLSDFL